MGGKAARREHRGEIIACLVLDVIGLTTQLGILACALVVFKVLVQIAVASFVAYLWFLLFVVAWCGLWVFV